MRLVERATAEPAPDLVIFPETALRLPFHMIPPEIIKKLVEKNKNIIISSYWQVDRGVLLDQTNTSYSTRLTYLNENVPWKRDKSHLVPFGEYVPPGFNWLVKMLRIPSFELVEGPKNQNNLVVGNVELAFNICFELVFPSQWRSQGASSNLIVNSSNIAWYGKDVSQKMHFIFSRARALEFQKPFVSVTNSGNTMHLSQTAEVIDVAKHNSEEILHVKVQPFTGRTPYSIFGDWIIIGFLLSSAPLLAAYRFLQPKVRIFLNS